MHILEDAWCGTVPFLIPWKRSVGMHVFRMSKNIGEMSAGEKTFVLCCVGISLVAFLVRTFTFKSFGGFLMTLWRNI